MLDYPALRTLRKASYSMTFQTFSYQFLNLLNLLMLDVILIGISFVKNVRIQLSAVSFFRLTPKIPTYLIINQFLKHSDY
ncbi:hypothetical protein Aazo_1044 ['Nostoc azollae' 0708]|jgi:hypothetical protein|uniref:Uncharacterized protein n=1 Tax=Nostoc azollae (strain 0708) TaxID=551115 RepID=D7E2M9_NOSA0|nr:hypothetical protein Aazo_1044 ['Nostoc azollae' 0708]